MLSLLDLFQVADIAFSSVVLVAIITTVFFSKNNKYFKGAKHMELKYLAVKEEVQKQKISIEHISTELMIANPLTKGLVPKTFNNHVNIMGLDRNP